MRKSDNKDIVKIDMSGFQCGNAVRLQQFREEALDCLSIMSNQLIEIRIKLDKIRDELDKIRDELDKVTKNRAGYNFLTMTFHIFSFVVLMVILCKIFYQ